MYDNFFINLAVHTSLLNLQFKKAKIFKIKIYTPLALFINIIIYKRSTQHLKNVNYWEFPISYYTC